MLILNIRSADIKRARSLGAFWDPCLKIWYLPDNIDDSISSTFYENGWIDFPEWTRIFPPFYEIHSSETCWKCAAKIPVTTLGVTKAVKYFSSSDREEEFSDPTAVVLCYNMRRLPEDIVKYFFRFRSFARVISRARDTSYWGVRCTECEATQGEYYTFHVPGGAFNSSDGISNNQHAHKITEIVSPQVVDCRLIIGYAFQKTDDEIKGK